MKWGGERGESFHPGETRSRCFQRLGNRVKRPLRRFIAISPIPCGRSRAIVAIFPRATGSSRSRTPISPPSPSFSPSRRPLLRRPQPIARHGSAAGRGIPATRTRQRREGAPTPAWTKEGLHCYAVTTSRFVASAATGSSAAADFLPSFAYSHPYCADSGPWCA